MDIAQFIKQNGVFAKLVAALDDIRNGNGWAVFDGLQNGEVTVNIRYDGEHCVFVAMPKLEPVNPGMPDPSLISRAADQATTTEPGIQEPVQEEGVNAAEETQVRRRRKPS